MTYFSDEAATKLRAERDTIEARTDNLVLKYVGHPFKDDRAREYAQHGFARRIGAVRRAVLNVFEIIPPEASRVPDRDVRYDAEINIQACLANTYGCIDNLAWVWIHEQGLAQSLPRSRVGFRRHNTEVRASLRLPMLQFLQSRDDWLDYLIEFRDATAHRIPIYIPPGNVPSAVVERYNALSRRMADALNSLDGETYERLSAEQKKLLVFQPLMTHSVREATGLMPFHVQLLSDFATVEEFGLTLLKELA